MSKPDVAGHVMPNICMFCYFFFLNTVRGRQFVGMEPLFNTIVTLAELFQHCL